MTVLNYVVGMQFHGLQDMNRLAPSDENSSPGTLVEFRIPLRWCE